VRKTLEAYREMAGGIIATVRAGEPEATERLLQSIRTIHNMPQLAAVIRNEIYTAPAVQDAYQRIDASLSETTLSLPSPNQLLAGTHFAAQNDHRFDEEFEEDATGSDRSSYTGQYT
jgi:hypothetical protein